MVQVGCTINYARKARGKKRWKLFANQFPGAGLRRSPVGHVRSLDRRRLALSPPRVRLLLYDAVVEVFAGVSFSSSCPLRRLPVDWTEILSAIVLSTTSGAEQG